MKAIRVVRLTPPGIGGIGVLLVTGEGVRSFLEGLVPIPRVGRARYGRILCDGRLLDEVLVLAVDPRDSPTGEPALEISAHGGPRVIGEILELLVGRGAVPLDREELRALAVRRGRIDRIGEEALALLEGARTERAARFYLEALGGSLRRELEGLGEGAAAGGGALAAALDALRRRARLALAFAAPPSVVLLGAPNAGKSSLLNRLVRRDAAIVAAEPGTTRDVVEADAAIRGIPVRFIDGAGLGPAPSAIEAEGVRRIRRAAEEADLALFLVEAGRPFRGIPPGAIPVRTKADLEGPAASRAAREALPPDGIRTSARTGEGIDALRERILRVLVGTAGDPPDPPAPFTARQLAAVEHGIERLRAGEGLLDVARSVLIECAGSAGTEGEGRSGRTEHERGQIGDP